MWSTLSGAFPDQRLRRGGIGAAVSTHRLMRYWLEILAQAVIDLFDGFLRGGHVADRIQQHEVMDRAIVTNRGDCHASILHLSCVSLAFVAERVVFSSDDECRR